jgi:hypothetical protein
LPVGSEDSTNFNEFLNPQAEHRNFYKELRVPAPQTLNTSLQWSLMTPSQHCPISVSQGKGRGAMHLPPPGRKWASWQKIVWKEKFMDSKVLAIINPFPEMPNS